MNRTLKFLGKVYGLSDATVSATIDGTTVFNGTIATSGIAVFDDAPFTPDTLFTAEIPVEFRGTKSVSITVTSGDVVFAEVMGNYFLDQNPVYTAEQFATLTNSATTAAERTAIFTAVASPALSGDDIALLESTPHTDPAFFNVAKDHNITLFKTSAPDDFRLVGPTDSRTNIKIDGKTPLLTNEGNGSYEVTSGSTMTYDLVVGWASTSQASDRSAGRGALDYTV